MPKGFDVRIDGGSAVDAGDDLTHVFSGLTASTEYDIEVRKRAEDGSVSAWSSVVSQTTQTPAASGLTYNHTSNMASEADGGLLATSTLPAYGHSIESIAHNSTDKFTWVPVITNLSDAGMFWGLIHSSNVPSTSAITNMPVQVEIFGGTIKLNLPVAGNWAFTVSSSGITSLSLGFDGSGNVRFYKNGTLLYTSSGEGLATGNWHFRLFKGSGYPVGDGHSSAVKE